MEYLRQFECGLSGSIVVICTDSYGHEVSMSLEDYTSNYYCPINVPSKEELEVEVVNYMARKGVGRRVAFHEMIEGADNSSELSIAWGDDNGADEQHNRAIRLTEMLETEPVAEVVKNTIGNMFPQLAQLGL